MSDGYAADVFRAMYRAPKPGGALGFVEHRASAGPRRIRGQIAATVGPRRTRSGWPEAAWLPARGAVRDQRQPERHEGRTRAACGRCPAEPRVWETLDRAKVRGDFGRVGLA